MANKTKQLIIDCFLSLVEKKDLEKISVTDLVEECQISRQTFYYHFEGIDEMLRWAFEEETKNICSKDIGSRKWVTICADYLPFLEKYNVLLKSCVSTSFFAYIYNLLAESTYKFSINYHVQNTKKSNIPESTKFMLKCTSLSFTGLIIQECQRNEPDYKKLMKKIEKVFDPEEQ